jgi:hypothetical protein
MKSKTNLRLVEAHADILGAHPDDLTAHSTMLAQLGLPYRKVQGGVFERHSGPYSLQLRAGSALTKKGFLRMDVPYGAKSRLCLLMLIGTAVRLHSRHVPVASSFTRFCRDTLGLDTGGKTLAILKRQLLNMSCVDMTIVYDRGSSFDVIQGALFSKLSLTFDAGFDQQLLWPDEIVFSEAFWESLQDHRYMLDKRAINALTHSSRALDLYCWLAYRCWKLKKPIKIRWSSLMYQFSDNPQTSAMRSFKPRFKTALKSALLVYPDCRVDLHRDYIVVHPSKPPVSRNWGKINFK